jgi:rubredoxin
MMTVDQLFADADAGRYRCTCGYEYTPALPLSADPTHRCTPKTRTAKTLKKVTR